MKKPATGATIMLAPTEACILSDVAIESSGRGGGL